MFTNKCVLWKRCLFKLSLLKINVSIDIKQIYWRWIYLKQTNIIFKNEYDILSISQSF